jgi:pyruvate formate lyase activating enzyme
MTVRGAIFKIERFAVHDGPGIRTVVFMKGCRLRCLWCSSPESQTTSPELGYDAEKCAHCGDCVETCSVEAITALPNGGIVTDIQRCDLCGECVAICQEGARKLLGEVVSAEAVVHETEKDSAFYHRSGGGVTLSGGEPTMQPEFATEILKGSLELGFHTAIETCGYVDREILDRILPYLDLIYIDIKHMSSDRHKELTGVGNELILANIKRIDEAAAKLSLIIRIPVIPDVNDSAENIRETAEFVSRLKRVERIELLPYHRYGLLMYRVLFRDYALQKVKVPSKEHLSDLKNIIRAYDIPVQIGG